MRKLRTLKNYSQEFVAERIGVDLSTYSRYERGETSLRLEQAIKLADLYNLTVDEFYHFDDPEYQKKSAADPGAWRKIPRVMITIELDGMDNSFRKVVQKLTAINKALRETTT